ncbi:hypothetical protein ACF0H5_010944 [Mactra antiquata]
MDLNSTLYESDASVAYANVSVTHDTISGGIGNQTFNRTCLDCNEPPRVFESPPLQAKDIVIIHCYALIFLLAVLGNALVIITLIQNKRMRTVTNVFLLNLSISDLLLAVFCMPFTIIPMMLKNFIFGAHMCVIIRYLQAVSVSVSCFTLVAISLERYFAICRPLQSREWQTLSHSYKTIAVCWIAAFVASIPIAIYSKYRQSRFGNAMCGEVWPSESWQKAYTLYLDFILLLLPVFIMAISYGKISLTLWRGIKMDKVENESNNDYTQSFATETSRRAPPVVKDGFGRTSSSTINMDNLNNPRKVSSKLRFSPRGIRQTNNEKSRAAKKRVIKMLFAVVLEFFICWTPLFFLQTWITMDIRHAEENISPFALTLVFLLSYVSACCNPITYCFMNRNFRNGFKSAFRCGRKSDRFKTRNDMPSYYHYSTGRTSVSHFSTSYDKITCKYDSEEM